MLAMFANLAGAHREHEKYYGESPLDGAAALKRASRTLKALAEHWQSSSPATPAPSPFAGAPDLNDDRATETAGVLFMESGEAPVEITRLIRDLETAAADAEATGSWLASAMEATWAVAESLLDFPELADLLGERHAIIARDWQSAAMLQLVGRQLRRAIAILGRVDFSVAAMRADLGPRSRSARLTFSAAELIDQAADLTLHSAMLVGGNERRWRVFRGRIAELTAEPAPN